MAFITILKALSLIQMQISLMNLVLVSQLCAYDIFLINFKLITLNGLTTIADVSHIELKSRMIQKVGGLQELTKVQGTSAALRKR